MFISMEAPSVCFVNKAQGECLLYLAHEKIWIDKKTARSGRALLGCGARGNAISFWCSCSAKQTLCAMPPGQTRCDRRGCDEHHLSPSDQMPHTDRRKSCAPSPPLESILRCTQEHLWSSFVNGLFMNLSHAHTNAHAHTRIQTHSADAVAHAY